MTNTSLFCSVNRLRKTGLKSLTSKSIVKSIEKTLSIRKNRTKDLNGSCNTKECAKAVLDNLS